MSIGSIPSVAVAILSVAVPFERTALGRGPSHRGTPACRPEWRGERLSRAASLLQLRKGGSTIPHVLCASVLPGRGASSMMENQTIRP